MDDTPLPDEFFIKAIELSKRPIVDGAMDSGFPLPAPFVEECIRRGLLPPPGPLPSLGG